MSDKSLESILKLLTSDQATTEQLLNIAKNVVKNDENGNEVNISKIPKTTDRLQLKIELINALIPLLSEKATEQAQFLVKLLSIIAIISQLKNTDI